MPKHIILMDNIDLFKKPFNAFTASVVWELQEGAQRKRPQFLNYANWS